jgi:hypothetical protein
MKDRPFLRSFILDKARELIVSQIDKNKREAIERWFGHIAQHFASKLASDGVIENQSINQSYLGLKETYEEIEFYQTEDRGDSKFTLEGESNIDTLIENYPNAVIKFIKQAEEFRVLLESTAKQDVSVIEGLRENEGEVNVKIGESEHKMVQYNKGDYWLNLFKKIKEDEGQEEMPAQITKGNRKFSPKAVFSRIQGKIRGKKKH